MTLALLEINHSYVYNKYGIQLIVCFQCSMYICTVFCYNIITFLAKNHEQKYSAPSDQYCLIISHSQHNIITYDFMKLRKWNDGDKTFLRVRICILSRRNCILSTSVCLKYLNWKTEQCLGKRKLALKNTGLLLIIVMEVYWFAWLW